MSGNAQLPDYAVCTPYWGARDGDHLDCVATLATRYPSLKRYRVVGCAYIDIARSALCRIAERQGHSGVLFIDHDIIFNPDDAAEIIRTAEREQCVISGIYCMRASADRIIGCFDASIKEVVCFEGGQLYPGPWSGLGFTAIPMQVLRDVGRSLPRLKTGFIQDVLPMFALRSGADAVELARKVGDVARENGALELAADLEAAASTLAQGWYSGEDISFFHRVSEAGHRLMIDTRPRLFHKGTYLYGLEDAQVVVPRARTLNMTLIPKTEPAYSGIQAACPEQFEGFGEAWEEDTQPGLQPVKQEGAAAQ